MWQNLMLSKMYNTGLTTKLPEIKNLQGILPDQLYQVYPNKTRTKHDMRYIMQIVNQNYTGYSVLNCMIFTYSN